jgi:hypothetical protein
MCVCVCRGADDAAACDGMEQAAGEHGVDCLDCVITNILVVDYTGIYKCDLGVCVYLKRRVPSEAATNTLSAEYLQRLLLIP